MSFFWGFDVIVQEGYISKGSLLWENFPEHPMIFLHKLYFIIQLAYYLHMLPELYFQKIKKEDQQPKIIHAICSFSFIALAYFMNFQRVALVLLTLHYLSEVVSHVFQLIEVFDRDEKLSKLKIVNRAVFVLTRFATMVLSVLALYYGIENSPYAQRGLIALFAVFTLQGYLVFQFISNVLKARRASQVEQNQPKKKTIKGVEKTKKERKRESDLPEADQDSGRKVDSKKSK